MTNDFKEIMDAIKFNDKKNALNMIFPGGSCGNQECEVQCADACQIAKMLNCDPKLIIQNGIDKHIAPKFGCIKNCDPLPDFNCTCKFGYIRTAHQINSDIKDYSDNKKVFGIKHVSCDSKNSCALCKAFDGKIYKLPEDELIIPLLPLHPNCRCKQEEITDKKVFYKLLDEQYKDGSSVTVRIDDSPGWGGLRASGIDDMLNKLEETHLNGGIRELIISNHGGLEGSFPMGNGDDLTRISSTQVDRLKKLLSSNAIIDIRMCYSSGDKDGNEAAQKLANKIGVRILGYEGPVSPYGTRPGFIKIDKDRPGNYFQHIFPDNKPKIFYPEE